MEYHNPQENVIIEKDLKQVKHRVNLDEAVPALAQILMDYCCLRNIVFKQYEHYKNYPNDIVILRRLWGDDTSAQLEAVWIEKFIRYLDYCLGRLIFTHKTENVSIYRTIYSYGYDNHNNYFYKNLIEKFNALNDQLTKSLLKRFDFDQDFTVLSTITDNPIQKFCSQIIDEANDRFQVDRNRFIQTRLFKSYVLGNYTLVETLDTIDVKLNGFYYDKFIHKDVNDLFYNLTLNTSNNPYLHHQ